MAPWAEYMEIGLALNVLEVAKFTHVRHYERPDSVCFVVRFAAQSSYGRLDFLASHSMGQPGETVHVYHRWNQKVPLSVHPGERAPPSVERRRNLLSTPQVLVRLEQACPAIEAPSPHSPARLHSALV